MNKPSKRPFVYFVALLFAFMGIAQPIQAALIGTDQVARGATAAAERARILAQLERPEVVAELQRQGVAKKDAVARVNALTDEEAAIVADRLETVPAGASDVLGVIVLIFVVLLVTDILGFTKVFPFTRSVR